MAAEVSQKNMPSDGSKSKFTCGTDQLNGELLADDPGYRARRQAVESFSRLARSAPSTRTGQANIPVVVHVVYKTEEQKVKRPQIEAQIGVLNKDYKAENQDISRLNDVFKPLVGNPNIHFFLATRKPDGSSTDGIVYKQTTADDFPLSPTGRTNRKMKSEPLGSKGWPASRYLNLWVCNMGDPLGYASFPGTDSLTEDGVVIDYHAFGVGGTAKAPYHLGRTTTHEVGHWLNLRHIWGDDYDPRDNPNDPNVVLLRCSESDLVDDTPNQSGMNYGVPTFPNISCGNGPNGDLFYNYMDYCHDEICVMFTKGQVERMNATLAGSRVSLLGPDFNNRRISNQTAIGEVKDESIYFIVYDWQTAGKKDLVAIDKQKMTMQILSADSKYQTDVFQNEAIGFKADNNNPNANLLFAFNRTNSGEKPDLYVLQSSPKNTNLSIVSAKSSYRDSSVLNAHLSLHSAGPVYAFAVAPWTKESSKPDLIVLQKPTIRLNSYSVRITVLSGTSGFSKTIHEFTTPALDNSSSSLDLQLADWNGDGSLDLVVIKKSTTSSKRTEVTVLSGLSGFTDVIFKTNTLLGGTERNFTFLCADWTGDGAIDLVGIKRWDTGSGKVEVHVLAG